MTVVMVDYIKEKIKSCIRNKFLEILLMGKIDINSSFILRVKTYITRKGSMVS